MKIFLPLIVVFFAGTIALSQSDITFTVEKNEIKGDPGEHLVIYGEFINTGDQATTVRVRRSENNMTAGWTSAICTGGLCLAEFVDSTEFNLKPDSTMSFSFYFYTTPDPAEGNAVIDILNLNNPGNSSQEVLYGSTLDTSNDIMSFDLNLNDKVKLYPNPVYNDASIRIPAGIIGQYKMNLHVFNILGLKVEDISIKQEVTSISCIEYEKGVYLYDVKANGKSVATGKFLVK